MRPCRYILLLILACGTRPSCAQDIISTARGTIIRAHVKSASLFRVRYYLDGDKDSVLHTLPGVSVVSIEYADGHIMRLNPAAPGNPAEYRRMQQARVPRVKTRQLYKAYSNVLTVNLPNLIVARDLFGAAWGAQYERYFGRKGYISVDVPFYFTSTCFDHAGKNQEGIPYQKGKMNYFAPGVHFHPFGNNRGADLSLGITYGMGQMRLYTLMLERNTYRTDTLSVERKPVSLAALNVNLNFHTTNHFVCGIYLEYGRSYSPNSDAAPFFQIGLKLGGGF